MIFNTGWGKVLQKLSITGFTPFPQKGGTPVRLRRGKLLVTDKPRMKGARTLNICNQMPNHTLTILMRGGPNQVELERRCHAWLAVQEQRRAEANAVQV